MTSSIICPQGRDYIFFEITEPEELAYTYKVDDNIEAN